MTRPQSALEKVKYRCESCACGFSGEYCPQCAADRALIAVVEAAKICMEQWGVEKKLSGAEMALWLAVVDCVEPDMRATEPSE
jgi:hypothetical protein